MTDPERLSAADLAWLEQLDRELTAELSADLTAELINGATAPPTTPPTTPPATPPAAATHTETPRSVRPLTPAAACPASAPVPAARWTTWLASFVLLGLDCGALAVAASTSSVLWTALVILLMPVVVLPFLWDEHRRARRGR